MLLVQLRAGGHHDSRRRLQVRGGEEQDSTSGHVGKHPRNRVNHTIKARQERSTSPCGKMDMTKQRNGIPDSLLESTKKTRTTGEKMEG